MNVYLIKASEESAFKAYKRYMGAPPQNIFSAAAALPEGVGVEMCDETVSMRVNYRSKADLIVIFMSTPDALRAYDIAKTFRRKGKTILFGGLHATFLPEEVLAHGDAVIIGEIEGLWERILEDYATGNLQQRYQLDALPDLDQLKAFPTTIVSPRAYQGYWSVTVGRGCNNACTYCTVHPFFRKMRFRPIANIVDEIRNCGAQYVELHADNLTADRDYALELFKALEPLNIRWSGETTINFADDEELLYHASKSGLHFLLVGLETPSRKALDQSGKGFVSTEQVKQQIARLHEYQVSVDSAFLFGFDEHDSGIFEETLDFVKEIDLDSTHSVIVIPFPGTANYRKLENEGRILTRDWSKYDGAHAVFQPQNMSVEELEYGAYWFYKKISKLNKQKIKHFNW